MTRNWLIGLFLAAVSQVAAHTVAPLLAANPPSAQQITFRETLEKGLRVRLERDRQYVGRVAALVEQGTLPRELVLTIFQKARLRNSRVPTVYFRQALTIVAAQRGVQIPY